LKLGIISDVHGNLEALEAVVGFLRGKGAVRFVCCGDIVGYGPDPNRCIEIVRELDCLCVVGNHDYAVTGKISLDGFNSSASRAVLWTRPLLSESNRLYLESLPFTAEEGPFFVVHSAPSAPGAWEYVLTAREAARQMAHFAGRVCLAGHSHQPFAVERVPEGRVRVIRNGSFDIRPAAKYFINAGSVGQPRDGDPRACCLLYDDGTKWMTYFRVPYDVPSVQAKIRAAGLPDYLASRLRVGC
jgi:predicted phosphodiesterase